MKRLGAIVGVVALVGLGSWSVLGVSQREPVPERPAVWADGQFSAPPTLQRAESAAAAPRGVEDSTHLRVAAGAPPAALAAHDAAPRILATLQDVDRPSELMGLTRVIADDPEMSALLLAQAQEWRTSADPELRARGLLLVVGLGRLDAAAWQGAVATEPDAEARALMVASPPLGGLEDRRVVNALIDRLRFDDAGAVRLAALDALPALEATQTQHVVTALTNDRDPGVRRLAAVWLRGAGLDGSDVASGLFAAAADDQDPAVRRAAAVALIRLEEQRPGALAAAGGTKEELADVLAATSGDRG